MNARISPAAIGPAVVLGLLAFLLTITWHVQESATEVRAGRRAQLAHIVEARQRTTDQLERRLGELRRQADAAAARSGGARLAEVRALMQRLAGLSGASQVIGPGIVVTLSDSGEAAGEPGSPDFRIQDVDVQLVVNALWVAGAEAIAVDGQRLVATSAIRNAGPAVLVNYVVLTSPYRIAAIGDPRAVREAFERSAIAHRFRNWVEIYGLGFSMSTRENVTLPAFGGSLRFRYARPTGVRTGKG